MRLKQPPASRQAVAAFERGELALPQLDHEGHVFLAWSYLVELPLIEAVARFPRAIKGYAEAQGATDKYNATLTTAFLLLIYQRMRSDPEADWPRFVGANPDLLVWPGGPIGDLYSDAILSTSRARRELVPPDRSRRAPEDVGNGWVRPRRREPGAPVPPRTRSRTVPTSLKQSDRKPTPASTGSR